MNSEDPIALVTGAGRPNGIGVAVAAQLARSGMAVILTARRDEDASARTSELRAQGLDVIGHAMDVTNPDAIRELAAVIERDHGRLDVLVNNAAGITVFGESTATADLATARAAMEATLFGAWQTSQALLPLLRRSAHPRIVNVSSGAGSHGDTAFGLTSANAMGTGYAVAKAALNALTARLAFEERAHRLLVNAVCPGFTATFEGGAQMGARPVQEGAASVVWAALLPDDGPTGGFFRDGQTLPW